MDDQYLLCEGSAGWRAAHFAGRGQEKLWAELADNPRAIDCCTRAASSHVSLHGVTRAVGREPRTEETTRFSVTGTPLSAVHRSACQGRPYRGAQVNDTFDLVSALSCLPLPLCMKGLLMFPLLTARA